MKECPKLARCPFFNDKMANRPASSTVLKTNFCKGAFAPCARFIVWDKLGGNAVPGDLFPHQADRAAQLIGQ